MPAPPYVSNQHQDTIMSTGNYQNHGNDWFGTGPVRPSYCTDSALCRYICAQIPATAGYAAQGNSDLFQQTLPTQITTNQQAQPPSPPHKAEIDSSSPVSGAQITNSATPTKISPRQAPQSDQKENASAELATTFLKNISNSQKIIKPCRVSLKPVKQKGRGIAKKKIQKHESKLKNFCLSQISDFIHLLNLMSDSIIQWTDTTDDE